MAISVTLTTKLCGGDLQAQGFGSIKDLIEYHLTYLHFKSAEDQVKWLNELKDSILPEAIRDMTEDFGLNDKKEIYCQACSEAGGADRAIYHLPPACPLEPI